MRSLLHHPSRRAFATVVAVLLGACSPKEIHQAVTGSLQVSSTSITAGAIANDCGCNGAGASPQISWSDPPPGTKSFALIMDDRDATTGHLHRHYFVHWLAFDLPPDARELGAGLPTQSLPGKTQPGTNDVGKPDYAGLCPDAGTTHHYAITVYALDTRLALPAATKAYALLTAIDGHVLARGQILGTYTH